MYLKIFRLVKFVYKVFDQFFFIFINKANDELPEASYLKLAITCLFQIHFNK